MAPCRVAALADLWDGDMMACAAEGRPVLLVRLDGRIYAYEDRCAHLGVRLSEGKLDDAGVLTCSAHQYQYDARTGEGINPRAVRIAAYPVRVEGGDVLVDAAAPPGEGGSS